MAVATVTDDSPLTIRFTGDLEDTPVRWKETGASYAVNDVVWAELDDFTRKAVIVRKLATA